MSQRSATATCTGRARRAGLRAQPWLPAALACGNRFHHRHKTPWRHNLLNLGALALLLGALFAVALASVRAPPALYLPGATLAFGLLIFALFILVVHEAAHGMFVISRPPARAALLNRVAGWAVCIPFGIDYEHHWRVGHVIHHVDLNEAHDPQGCVDNVLTGRVLARAIALDLIPGYAHFVRKYDDCAGPRAYPFSPRLVAGQIGFWSALVAGSALWLEWTVPLAFALGAQLVLVLNRLKIAMEHGGPMLIEPNPFLRSASSFFPLRHLLMPLNISLHFEHHVNFNVPWYDLGRYHAALLDVVPAGVQSRVFRTDRAVLDVICDEDRRPYARALTP